MKSLLTLINDTHTSQKKHLHVKRNMTKINLRKFESTGIKNTSIRLRERHSQQMR